MFFRYPLIIGLSVLTLSSHADVQTDCDLDGVSDLTYTAASGTETTWSCLGSTSDADDLDTTFGLTTDTPAPAKWIDPETLSLVVIRQSGTSLVWKLLEDDSSVLQKKFGKAADNTLAGGDFNGDGIADAAVVRFEDSHIRWQIKPNLFNHPRSTQSFAFGRSGDRVFYFNPNGQRDCAAAFGSSGDSRPRLTFRDAKTRKVRTFTRFSSALAIDPRPRPFPVGKGDGSDNLGFVIEDESDTTIRVLTFRGRSVDKHVFPGKGTIVVGDFDVEREGEEIILQTSSAQYIYNPLDKEVEPGTSVSGTLIDEININVVGTVEASPTPTPDDGEVVVEAN